MFIENKPDIEELQDSIVWCLEHKSDIGKYSNNNNGRNSFIDDKHYFENSIKTIISKTKEIQNKTNNNKPNTNAKIQFNTLTTIIKYPTYKFYPEKEEENHCNYISSRGFLKACDIHSLTPVSSIHDLIGYDLEFSLKKLKETRTQSTQSTQNIYSIYICNTAIPKFAEKIKNVKDENNIEFNKLNCKYILVSGDSDDTCPDDLFESDKEFKEFIENDKIIHWYSQNYIHNIHNIHNIQKNHHYVHKKLSQIPIGLAYHHHYNEDIVEESNKIISPMKQEALLDSIRNTTQQSKKMKLPFWKREVKCYINFNFERNYMRSRFGYDRYEAITKIPKHLTFSETEEVERTISWTTQAQYAFVVSPFGNGYDCHRTWEALLLGCIPIVKTSGLDSLYDELPVLIVQDWSDITEKLLMNVITDFKKKHENNKFNYDKLTLKYWMDKINSHKYT